MIKRPMNQVYDTDNDVELELEAEEGAEILGFRKDWDGDATINVMDLIIDQRVMCSFPLAPRAYVPESLLADCWEDIYAQARRRFPEIPPFRVPNGKKANLIGPDDLVGCAMHYRVLEGDQVPAENAPGAPKGSSAFRILLGTNAEDITEVGWHKFNKSWGNPVLEKSPFEDDEELPWDFRVYGILGHGYSVMSTMSDLIRMFIDDTEMLSDDSLGIPYPGFDLSAFADHDVGAPPEMMWFEKPWDIKGGQKVRIEYHATMGPQGQIDAGEVQIALVGLINPEGGAGQIT